MKQWKVQRTASSGYAIGPAYVVERKEIAVGEGAIPEGMEEEEISRFRAAVEKVQGELETLAGENEIFAAHAILAGDVAILEGVSGKIRENRMGADRAMAELAREYVQVFESMEDEYMRERAADMQDVSRRILMALGGIEDNPFAGMKEKCVVVARDLAPSDTAKMDPALVLGFATEEGGVTSHVSIIAKNMDIPCLVGAGALLGDIRTGDTVILDAGEGVIISDPEPVVLEEYRKREQEYVRLRKELLRDAALPGVTRDGHSFSICVNVGNLEEVRQALQYPIDGVGLFRSEFLYMESDHFPGEEEQFTAYKEAASLLGGKELTIRTLDIGGDKALDYFEFPREENPFLGYRAIRMCLDLEEMFQTQLRAILRASAFGHIRIMYPMVTSLDELEKANALLDRCKEELIRENIEFDREIQAGIMVETPAAVLMAEELAKEADFFSVGTNDLTQYILAADRGNQKIAGLYDPFHPAVLRAIFHTIDAGHKAGIQVGMCGEFASDERAALLLLGMGLDEFSMSAPQTAAVKRRLRECSYEEGKKLALAALGKSRSGEVTDLLAE